MQQKIREVRHQHRNATNLNGKELKARAEKYGYEPGTADDAFRALGTLIAMGRYSDKLILCAKALAEDPWLNQRAPKKWIMRNAMYL